MLKSKICDGASSRKVRELCAKEYIVSTCTQDQVFPSRYLVPTEVVQFSYRRNLRSQSIGCEY
jgi:hypothetical protein